MTYEPALAAIADPTRRLILDGLRPGPQPVGALAQALPVSRPAVSQHLKVMLEAGLVTVEKQGTKNLYALAPSGLDTLRAWLDGLWTDALESHARGATQEAEVAQTLPPVTKVVHVSITAAEAFKLFTEDLSLWWPVSTHSLSGADGALPQSVVMDAQVGGAIVETRMTGEAEVWATITALSPGTSVELDWHVGRPAAQATQVAVRFDAAGRGSKVTLIHKGWETLGNEAETQRTEYDSGWDHVFVERFAASAENAVSNFSSGPMPFFSRDFD